MISELLVSLTPSRARVLDIGCGEGELLTLLEKEKQTTGQGIEIDSARVNDAVRRGLSVIQGDADEDLAYYPERAFDVVILNRSLQAMKQPKDVLQQSLRVGKQVIVVIPNFGQIRNRLYLLLRGRMPVTKKLSYEWYETPNIHFCTIRDMVALAEALDARIERRFARYNGHGIHPFSGHGSMSANLLAEQGIFLLSRR